MKRLMIGMAAVVLVSGTALGAGDGNGLQVARAIIASDPDGATPDHLRIRLFVKNIGSDDLTVLTRDLQVTLFIHTDKPAELSLDLSSQMKIDGSLVIPSLSDLSPVTLRPGEIAEIRIFYQDKRNLKNVVVSYDMRNDIAKRYNAWKGIVRSDGVAVLKTTERR